MLKNAKWIAKQSATNKIYPAPMFRKSFEITKQIKKATLDICGLGLLLCYVNGEKVSDEVLLENKLESFNDFIKLIEGDI